MYQEYVMSAVQISLNSVLLNPADVNPLASPAYQHPIHNIKELNNKANDQIKTDTVTISQEAVAKSVELKTSEETSNKKVTNAIKESSQSTQLQLVAKSDVTSKEDSASSIDQLTISSEASLKSSILKALSEAAMINNPETAYENLRP